MRNRTPMRPEAASAMRQFKMEVANELGMSDYENMDKGNLSSRENGTIGGNMTKKMVAYAEQNMANNMNQTNAQLYGLPMGVLVHEVVSGSCSEAAGVRPKDIITQLGGYDVENMNDLTRAMRHFSAGETVSLVVYRHSDGGEVFLSVTLDAKPQQNAAQSSETSLPTGGSADDWFDHFFG